MKRLWPISAFILLSFNSIANTCSEFTELDYKTKYLGANSAEEYCQSNAEKFVKKLCVKSGRMGISNEGGFFGLPTGVCWWHSEFHRKMNYLTFYSPQDKSTYNDQDFKELLKRIDHYQVTEIKGYKSFEDLVTDKKFPNRPTVIRKFLQKELYQSSAAFGWVRGLEGKPNRAAFGKHVEKQRASQLKEIKKVLASLQTTPNKMKPVYMMVQYPGVVAHAYTVYEIETITGKFPAYRMLVQDSNYQEPKDGPRELFFDVKSAQWFRPGEYKKLADSRNAGKPLPILRNFTWEEIRTKEPHVSAEEYDLYVQRSRDLERINESYQGFCGKKLFAD